MDKAVILLCSVTIFFTVFWNRSGLSEKTFKLSSGKKQTPNQTIEERLKALEEKAKFLSEAYDANGGKKERK